MFERRGSADFVGVLHFLTTGIITRLVADAFSAGVAFMVVPQGRVTDAAVARWNLTLAVSLAADFVGVHGTCRVLRGCGG